MKIATDGLAASLIFTLFPMAYVVGAFPSQRLHERNFKDTKKKYEEGHVVII